MAATEAKPVLAGESLRDKENIYKFLLDNSKEIILILSKRGKILFANKAVLNNFGYSEAEIIGKRITHFLTKDSIRRSLYALAQEFLGRAQPEMEVKAKTKSGEIRYLNVAMGSAPVYDKGKLIGMMVCGSDMTPLRKTEEELGEKEKRFRELWDNAPVAYHTVDINGIITDVNQTELRMLGYAKEEMLGQSIFAFILPEQQAEAQRRFRQKISGQKISRAERRIYLKKDGSKIYVGIDDGLERDSRGKVIGVRTTMVDITERKLAEEALKESEERFRSVVEHSYEGIFIIDDAYRFVYCNDELSRLLGYPREEIIGQDFRKFLDDESKQLVVDRYVRRQRGEEIAPRYEFIVVRKDGRKRHVEISSAVIKDSSGKIKTVAELLDITERKRAEEALRESEEKYRTLTENVNLGVYRNTVGPKGRFLEANPAVIKMFGFNSKEEFLAINVSNLYQNSEDRKNFNEKMLRNGLAKDEELLLKKKDGTPFIASISAVAVKDKRGNIEYYDGIIEDITERKKMEKLKNSIYRISEAAHSAQDLDELFRSIHNIIGELMPAKNFYLALYDYDREMLSFPYFADEYDETPAPKKLGKGLTEYVLRSGEPLLASPGVFDDLVKKGEVEPIGAPSIDWLGVPLKTENKTFGIMVVQSYTEGVRFKEEDKEILKLVSAQTAMAIKRKHAEKQIKDSLREKEALLQEIHHRVKNNLQIISSLLNLQSRQIKDKDFIKMVKDSQSRIRSMALVHEKLYGSRDFSNINFSDYVRSLAIQLFQFHQVDPNLIQLKMNLGDVFLNIQTAIPCGLILNELITNSLKHAFPNGRGGEILIELHPFGEQTFQIIVQDNGVGIPGDLDLKQTTSMGLQIVTILVNQLEGSLEMQREGGTAAKVLFKELRYKPRL